METGPNPSLADLNDAFRRTCTPFVTPGIMLLRNVPGLIQTVRAYDDFNSDNDPYGEHDFGALAWDSERVYWKIDYYDQTLTYGAEDPLSPDCRRVLTVLLASEY